MAARTSITRFIHKRWITLKGGSPITQADMNTIVTMEIFIVI
jgi:hypothetical protein